MITIKNTIYLIALALGTQNIAVAQVGIGTTSPTEILDLESNSASKTALDINCTGAGDPMIHFQISGTAAFTMGVDNSDADKFKIGTTALETATALTITSAGLVGLGTNTVPEQNLSVTNGVVIDMASASDGTITAGVSTQGLIFGSSSGEGITSKRTAGGNQYGLELITSSTARLSITNGGNVGIGCTSPQYALHVIGDIASNATVRSTNAVVTGAITACSDFRYKKEISPLTSSLDNILKLSGVSYLWKNEEFPNKNFSTQLQIGVIAQEVEKIYPQLVFTDIDGYKSVDYSRFTPILIEAVKEQQKIIDAQNLEIANQQKQYQELKILLTDLKKQQVKIEAELNLKSN
ncbi:MAG: tail fiber domain-containing protein [Bacteroidetes bacterium]|nr:tail fiber domain-containing protein [Bacteroidota bacterium]